MSLWNELSAVGLTWEARNACGKKERWRSGLAHEICTPSSAVWTAAGVMDEGISEVRCNFCLVDGWTQDGQVHESLSQR
jgi:hypothetical protein